MKTIEGIIPVMLTPFTADNKIDYLSLKRLIDWYIENGADALFAVFNLRRARGAGELCG